MILINSNYGISNQNQLQVIRIIHTHRQGCQTHIHNFQRLYTQISMAVYTILQITIDSWYKPFPNGWFVIVLPTLFTCTRHLWFRTRPGDGERCLRQHSGGAGGELGFFFFGPVVCPWMPFPNEWRFLAGKIIYKWEIYTMAVTIYIYIYIHIPYCLGKK